MDQKSTPRVAPDPASVAGVAEDAVQLGGCVPDQKVVMRKNLEGELDHAFRWKEMFLAIQRRNESPSLLVYQALLSRGPLLESRMEAVLEEHIRSSLSAAAQDQLEKEVRDKLASIDEQSMEYLEDLLKITASDATATATDEQLSRWLRLWKSNKGILKMLAQKYAIDLDQSPEQLGIQTIRAINRNESRQRLLCVNGVCTIIQNSNADHGTVCVNGFCTVIPHS